MPFPSASSTSQHGMNLFISYFNSNIPSDTKEIDQFDISGKHSKKDSVNQAGKQGEMKSREAKDNRKEKVFKVRARVFRKERGSQSLEKGRRNQKEKVDGPHSQVPLLRGLGNFKVKIKEAKDKPKNIKNVFTVVVKVTQ